MKVAIDGPAGSGKSTVAKAVAQRCRLTYLDTGAMYRALAWRCLCEHIPADDEKRISQRAQNIDIVFLADQSLMVDGVEVKDELRSADVDALVPRIASFSAVRKAMVLRQQKIGENKDIIAEGRDIATVVFPDAEVKIFLTADPRARAFRRAAQREGKDAACEKALAVDKQSEEKILSDILARDKADSSRTLSPLRPAADAVHIDSSDKSLQEVIDEVVSLVDAARSKKNVKGSDKKEKSCSRLKAFAGNSFDDYRDCAMKDFPLPTKIFTTIIACLLWLLTKILWFWKIEGAEKLLDKTPRVIIMNHNSMLDPVLTFTVLYLHGIHCRSIYKSEFDKNKIMSWLLARGGGIPVNRGTADLKAIRRAQNALKAGECILIYPEGTRIRSDEEENNIHGGFALIAHLAKTSVQPVAIVGSRDISLKGCVLKRIFWRVYLKVGDALNFSELGVKGRKAQIATMEKLSMERVYQLRDELRLKHPGKH